MIVKYIIAWLILPILGIINGFIREVGYKHLMGELTAHQISTLTGIVFFGLYIWFLTGVWRIESAGQAVAIGLIWLGLTILFEFVFGHYVMKHPWSRLFQDYNILKGRLWVLVLVWTTIAPYVFFRIRS
jgi:hypothetical protein